MFKYCKDALSVERKYLQPVLEVSKSPLVSKWIKVEFIRTKVKKNSWRSPYSFSVRISAT